MRWKDAGFESFKVSHRFNFVDLNAGVYSKTWKDCRFRPNAEIWNTAETSRHHLYSYFCEFKWHQLPNDDDLFVTTLNAITHLNVITTLKFYRHDWLEFGWNLCQLALSNVIKYANTCKWGDIYWHSDIQIQLSVLR